MYTQSFVKGLGRADSFHNYLFKKKDNDPNISTSFEFINSFNLSLAAGTQLVRAFAPQAKGWAFESQPRQI